MSNKSTRISVNELSHYANQGIERALEARQAAGVDLSPDQLNQVSGGLVSPFVNGGIINGLYPIYKVAQVKQIFTQFGK